MHFSGLENVFRVASALLMAPGPTPEALNELSGFSVGF